MDKEQTQKQTQGNNIRVNGKVGNVERLNNGWRVNFDCETDTGALPIRTIQLVIDDAPGAMAQGAPYARGQVVTFTIPLGDQQQQASSAKT